MNIPFCAVAVIAAMLSTYGGADILSRADSAPVPAVVEKEDAPRPACIAVEACGRRYEYLDAPIVPSDFTVADELDRRRINAPLGKKLELVDEYLKNGADYKTALSVPFPLLVRFADGIARDVFLPPTDAEVVYGRGAFSVKTERAGRRLDEKRLYAALYCSLRFGMTDAIKAATEEIAPSVTAESLKGELVLRGEYVTDFSASAAGRAHNVALALSKLDGYRLGPGETLSFCSVVGERTEENGFKQAKIIVDGKYTDGVGGGVCQASTAVYNAALVAGLKCGCNAHSICPSYCPPGLDAMISEMSDLTVTNTTSRTVYFSCRAASGRGRVRIYGEKSEYTIVPQSEVVKTVPFELKETVDSSRAFFKGGEHGDRLLVSPGRDGFESVTYLCYYRGGALVKQEKLRANSYRSVPRVIMIAP